MKKFVAPLQAFAALLLCSGMAWMVFVLASINPLPPTANDLQARNTQDLSFANMNSTAVALAKQMIAEMAPSPSGRFFLPVTGRETATPGPGAAVTLKAVFTFSNSPTPYAYYVSPTSSRRRIDTPLPISTSTIAPTRTLRPATATNIPSTKVPTQTPISPTVRPATPTGVVSTATPVLPTATPHPPSPTSAYP